MPRLVTSITLTTYALMSISEALRQHAKMLYESKKIAARQIARDAEQLASSISGFNSPELRTAKLSVETEEKGAAS